MLQARQGERAAFETLVRRHQRPLLNFFLRMGVYTDAEDLVQQTFIRLYRYRQRYRPCAKFTTFLYLLARQVRIDELRRRRRREKAIAALAAASDREAPSAPPEGQAGLDDGVQRALSRLSERLRMVVVLGVLQERSYPEIADILRIPVGTVKSRMFNGLKELRRLLEEQGSKPYG
ncbi:MAG: RNA polymerase sigma factor [Kiritimatiellae bacterium]|nr:RNA polymerase sigma factor [Kiritimatiellia bacterium]